MAERKTTQKDLKPILLIDDEKRMVDSMKLLLSQQGDYKVDAAYSGKQGLGRIRNTHYDVVVTDLRMPGVDGEEIIRYIRDNELETMIVVITGHATTESAIEALQYDVYDYITKPFEFNKLKSSVEGALARLETTRLRNDMINMITHDIKVPLNSILGYTAMIFDEKTNTFHPQAKEFTGSITGSANKILALVDNFLTSCKVEAGKLILCLKDVDINYLLSDILTCLSPDIEKKRISLTANLPDASTLLQADENLLYRALSNLLCNAIKYSPIGGDVILRCQVITEEDSPLDTSTLLIEVKNIGEEIPRDDLPYLFEKFHRAKNVPYVKGTGLGLYVLKCIIDAHRGEVTVASSPQETVFTVYLPL